MRVSVAAERRNNSSHGREPVEYESVVEISPIGTAHSPRLVPPRWGWIHTRRIFSTGSRPWLELFRRSAACGTLPENKNADHRRRVCCPRTKSAIEVSDVMYPGDHRMKKLVG